MDRGFLTPRVAWVAWVEKQMGGAKIVIFRARGPRIFIRSRHMARRYGLFKARITAASRAAACSGRQCGSERGFDLVLAKLRFEIVFANDAFIMLAHAFDAVLIVTVPSGKLSHDFIRAAGDILERMAVTEPDLLAELKFVTHGARLSFRDVIHQCGDSLVY